MKKFICLMLAFLMLAALCAGCGKKYDFYSDNDSYGGSYGGGSYTPPSTPTEDEAPDAETNEETKPEEETDIEEETDTEPTEDTEEAPKTDAIYDGLQTTTFDNLNGTFVAFKDIIQPNAFTKSGDEYTGNIVFTHGTEAVPVTFIPSYTQEDSTLCIADQAISVSAVYPYGIDVVDLDVTDKQVELAIFDEGDSGDYKIFFFSFKNNNIIDLGSINAHRDTEIDTIGPCGGVALCDMRGTIIDPWECVRLGDPGTVLNVHKLIYGKMQSARLNAEIIGHTYTVQNGYPCFFKPMEEEVENCRTANVYFNMDFYTKTNPGDTIKVLKVYPSKFLPSRHDAYFVEYNGVTGLLFLMLGD